MRLTCCKKGGVPVAVVACEYRCHAVLLASCEQLLQDGTSKHAYQHASAVANSTAWLKHCQSRDYRRLLNLLDETRLHAANCGKQGDAGSLVQQE